MAEAVVRIGDYEYRIWDYDRYPDYKGYAEVIDKTKTSYSPVLTQISYQGRTYQITRLVGAYADCVNMTSAPTIPEGIVSLDLAFIRCASLKIPPVIPRSAVLFRSCFEGCTSLTEAPDFPRDVVEEIDQCFSGCTALERPPAVIPAISVYYWEYSRLFYNCRGLKTAPQFLGTNITNMRNCFAGCSALEEFPVLPTFNGADLTSCFEGCTNLPGIVRLPSGVANATKCFAGCRSIQEVAVNSTPANYTDIFINTENPIFVINAGSASATTWRAIANQYSNVHYEADDNPAPTLAYSVTRVNANGDTSESVDGTWAYVDAVSKIYSTLLPTGWTCVLDPDETTLSIDGVPVLPTWQRSSVTENNVTTVTSQAWISLGDINKRTFTLQIADDAKNGVGTIKSSKVSQLLAFILSASFATIDFLKGGRGVAIGTFAQAEGLHLAFDTALTGGFYLELDAVLDADLIQAIADLGWTDETLTSITLDRQTAALSVGQTLTLVAEVKPSGLSAIWSSLDPSIAEVSSAGVVSGVAAGTTIISAALNTGGIVDIETCTVTVS